jgi:hypothetical protein
MVTVQLLLGARKVEIVFSRIVPWQREDGFHVVRDDTVLRVMWPDGLQAVKLALYVYLAFLREVQAV